MRMLDRQAVGARDPLLARVVGALFVLAGSVGAVSFVLPHPEGGNFAALAAVDAAALAVGLACLAAARHIPRWTIHLGVAGASTLICMAIYFAGVAAGPYSTMFICFVLVAAYFFSRTAAALHLAWLLAGYGLVLAVIEQTGGYSPLARWLLVAFSLVVAGGLTSWFAAGRRAAEERADRFFRLSDDMLCTALPDGHFGELSPAWSRTLGYSPEELRARPFVAFVHPNDRERTEGETARISQGVDTVYFENRFLAKDGSWHWLEWSASLSGEPGIVYARASDVTERKRLDAEREELVERLHGQARTDALTGVPNRRWLRDELERELARAQRQGGDLCVAMVDLDRFKQFNDRHGHAAGDALLRDAASSWRAVLRVSDFLARYGEKEFAVLLPDCSPSNAVDVIERLRAATPAGETCSAGIALWDRHESPDTLVARADAALDQAKEAGRDRIIFEETAAAGRQSLT